MSKYNNPADKLSLIASVPKKVLGMDFNILQLAEENRRLNERTFSIPNDERIEILQNVNSRILGIGEKRSVSSLKQIKLIVQRQATFVTRDPIALCAISVMAIF